MRSSEVRHSRETPFVLRRCYYCAPVIRREGGTTNRLTNRRPLPFAARRGAKPRWACVSFTRRRCRKEAAKHVISSRKGAAVILLPSAD